MRASIVAYTSLVIRRHERPLLEWFAFFTGILLDIIDRPANVEPRVEVDHPGANPPHRLFEMAPQTVRFQLSRCAGLQVSNDFSRLSRVSAKDQMHVFWKNCTRENRIGCVLDRFDESLSNGQRLDARKLYG